MRLPTGNIEKRPNAERPLRYGVAVSPDGGYLLYAQSDYAVADLMLVDLP
jgi:hypothetical protein